MVGTALCQARTRACKVCQRVSFKNFLFSVSENSLALL